jgi:molybdopterin converting factor small subunit
VSAVRIPPPLRDATGGRQVVDANGRTVGDLLEDLVSRYPDLDGQLSHANVYVDGEDIRVLDELETPVDETSQIILLPAMAGGF